MVSRVGEGDGRSPGEGVGAGGIQRGTVGTDVKLRSVAGVASVPVYFTVAPLMNNLSAAFVLAPRPLAVPPLARVSML